MNIIKTFSARILPTFILSLSLCCVVVAVQCGCSSPQKTTYRAAGATSVTAEAAVRAYNAWAKQGKTTVAQNQKVKAAYEKYQASFALVCDLGAIYAASGSATNTPATAALQQALADNGAAIADIVNLVQTFGAKLP